MTTSKTIQETIFIKSILSILFK